MLVIFLVILILFCIFKGKASIRITFIINLGILELSNQFQTFRDYSFGILLPFGKLKISC